MALRVVGAGLGRTGTHSLKLALEQLLGAPCYHMTEVFAHPDHVPMWAAAMHDEPVDWAAVFDGYAACVDWPGAAVWESILAANPDAVVLLSTRSSAEEWWTSASRTIFDISERPFPPEMQPWRDMVEVMFSRLTPEWRDGEASMAAYDRHNATVRAVAPADRLVEWQPADGWQPLCQALGVPVPTEPFPLTNTTAEFRAMAGLDAPT